MPDFSIEKACRAVEGMAKNPWREMRELLCWGDAVQILSFISANSPELAQSVLATLPMGVPRLAIVHMMASQLWRRP